MNNIAEKVKLIPGKKKNQDPVGFWTSEKYWESVGIWMRPVGNTAYVACLPLLCQERLTSIVSTIVSATSWFSFVPGCTGRAWVARKLRLKSMMHNLKLACTAVLPDIPIIDEIPFMKRLNLLHPKWKDKQNTVMNEWMNKWILRQAKFLHMPTTLAFETFSSSLTRCTQLAIWLGSWKQLSLKYLWFN